MRIALRLNCVASGQHLELFYLWHEPERVRLTLMVQRILRGVVHLIHVAVQLICQTVCVCQQIFQPELKLQHVLRLAVELIRKLFAG